MDSHKNDPAWRRMVACAAAADFGIAVERRDNPLLAARPLVLLHPPAHAVVAEVSAEAAALGLVPGMPWAAAQAARPGTCHVHARPAHYAAVAEALLAALAEVSPEAALAGHGEVLLDLTGYQAYYRHDPLRIGQLLQERALAACGLTVAVGIGGDPTTARWAARQAGPDCPAIVSPDQAAARLAPVTLSELCGAGPGIVSFLAAHGVATCGDLHRVPVGLLTARFGNLGRRLWLMAQGRDPAPVRSGIPGAGARGVLLTLPPGPCDAGRLHAAFEALARRLLPRLAQDRQAATHLRLGLLAPEGWRHEHCPLTDAAGLQRHCRRFLRRHWFGEVVRQVLLAPRLPDAPAPQRELFPTAAGATARTTARPAPSSRPPGADRRRQQNRPVANSSPAASVQE